MEIKNVIKMYKILSKENIILNANLKEYTSFKIGGVANYMLFPTNIKQAKKILKLLNKTKTEFTVLGNATNVLIKGDLNVVVSLSKMNSIKIKNNHVFCESGVNLIKLNEILKEHNLSGMERSYGIPGSVGGGIVQNCGAFGFSISEKLNSVVLFNGKKIKKIKKDKLFFAYRTSEFKQNKNLIILGADFILDKGNKEDIEKRLSEINNTRKSKQPYNYPSAGSVFKRIDGIIISKLIDELGLKGKQIGGAMISEKHAGFIINYDNATYDDVINLINFIKKTVKDEKNIDLELEIVLL